MDIKEFILAKCLKGQSDIEIITEKDYISQPIVLPTVAAQVVSFTGIIGVFSPNLS